MNNFETAQRIKDGLPNQIRQNIEEVKIATKKIIKNNSKLGFFKDKDLIDIKDLILKGSIFKNKEIILTDESKKVLDFAVTYEDEIMQFTHNNPDLILKEELKKKPGCFSSSLNYLAIFTVLITISIELTYNIFSFVGSSISTFIHEQPIIAGVIFLFLLFSFPLFYLIFSGLGTFIVNIFLLPFAWTRSNNFLQMIKNISGMKNNENLKFPQNVFECKIKILQSFLDSLQSVNIFEIILNKTILKNVELIENSISLNNMEKINQLELILNQQRNCINKFDMVDKDIEKKILFEKIYGKTIASNFLVKWFELTKKFLWVGILLGWLSMMGGTPLLDTFIGGVFSTIGFSFISTLLYYLIPNRLLNKNIENRINASQVVQQYLNQQKENLIRKIQYCC